MKMESLVIPGQLNRGEYVLESCTRVAMRSVYLVGESPTAPWRREAKSQHGLPRGSMRRVKVAVFSVNASLWRI